MAGSKNYLTAVFSIFFIFAFAPANASVIYNNFDANDAYVEFAGWTLSSNSVGFQFSAAATGSVTSVDVGMGILSSSDISPQSVGFNLFSDSGSDSLGSLLETFTVVVNNRFGDDSGPISTGLLSGTTTLIAGMKYWLEASSLSGTNVPWNRNSIGDDGLRSVNGLVADGQSRLGAFRINSDAVSVSEPGSLSLIAIGLGLIGFARRHTGSRKAG